MRVDKKTVRRKVRYYFLLLLIFMTAFITLVTGAAIVSVNCHNAMNAERISLFEIERKTGETVVRVMGREYYMENDSEDEE